ncbi:hypothetical protein EV360DRAFT_48224 [Lentinula raphanica]|nr:hypothetical protein EV360DRAFT_48224 [Lentinula raphanica]
MSTIILLGTFDTKGEELRYVRDKLRKHRDIDVITIDVGRSAPAPSNDNARDTITIPSSLVFQYGLQSDNIIVSQLSREELNKHMARGATNYVKSLFDSDNQFRCSPIPDPVHGIISLGGSFGTSLASAVMRDACPLGFPKLIVSTMASGETGTIVGETDITLMYSIVDVVGLNSILRNVLSNAAGAIVGMASAYEELLRAKQTSVSGMQPLSLHDTGSHATTLPRHIDHTRKKLVRLGITMFGVTTPCVEHIRAHLNHISSTSSCPYTFEYFIFHATGHGGLAMETFIASNRLDALIDLTTTEIADHIVGGVMSAGPHRLEAAASRGIPTILSVGAVDVVNFGERGTVPERFKHRRLYEHNPSVTLMRTNTEECEEIGKFIVDKLQKYRGTGPCRDGRSKTNVVEVWLPNGGVSILSCPGEPFHEQKADEALFSVIRDGLRDTGIQVVDCEQAINDKEFAIGVADALLKVLDVYSSDDGTC